MTKRTIFIAAKSAEDALNNVDQYENHDDRSSCHGQIDEDVLTDCKVFEIRMEVVNKP